MFSRRLCSRQDSDPHCALLLIQNGISISQESLEEAGVDPSRVLVGVASNFGARMVGPGHAEHKSMKLVAVGELVSTGRVTSRLKRIEEVWSRAGFTVQASADIHTQVLLKILQKIN